MKWLGKGVLRYAQKDILPGDDIPEGIDKEVLDKLIKKGFVGEIPEVIKPGQRLKDAMAENAKLLKQVEILETEKKVLIEKVDVMEKDAGDFAVLEKEIADLKKKLKKAGA